MKFVNDLTTGSEIIKDRFPEFTNSQLVGDDSGWDNYAIIVDDEYLFRFPRRQESLDQIRREAEVLDILHAKLPKHIEVPRYLATNLDDDYPFVYYKMIQGQPLTKELYDGFSEEEKDRFVNYMVEFLHTLHDIDIENCKNLEKVNAPSKYRDFYQQVTKVCLKHLTPDEQRKIKRLFEGYLRDTSMQNYSPVAVHGDLSENHILITQNGIGIIDFSEMCYFDEAGDFMDVSSEELRTAMLDAYEADNTLREKVRLRVLVRPLIVFGDYARRGDTEQMERLVAKMKGLLEQGYGQI